MDKIMPVTIWADTTGQYDESEVLHMQEHGDPAIVIPVPESLLKQWWYDCLDFDREQVEAPEEGWPSVTDDDFYDWYYGRSEVSDSDSLYDWLYSHGYHWKRII